MKFRLNIAFQMDPLEGLNLKDDTSLAIIIEEDIVINNNLIPISKDFKEFILSSMNS